MQDQFVDRRWAGRCNLAAMSGALEAEGWLLHGRRPGGPGEDGIVAQRSIGVSSGALNQGGISFLPE